MLLLAIQWALIALLVVCVAGLVAPVLVRRPAPALASAAAVPEWWRCEACHRRWQSHGAADVSAVGLRMRRAVRRLVRRRGGHVPAWASARGSSRCPSCLSRNIRPSRQQTEPSEAVHRSARG